MKMEKEREMERLRRKEEEEKMVLDEIASDLPTLFEVRPLKRKKNSATENIHIQT